MALADLANHKCVQPAYLGDTSSSRSSTLLYDPTSLPPNPITTFPTIASVAGVIPPFTEAQIILRHAVEWIGWYHGCVHGPTFLEEVAEFWSLGDNRVELVNPAWLAVFFAQMAAGVRHMVPQQLAALGTYGLSEGKPTSAEPVNAARPTADTRTDLHYRRSQDIDQNTSRRGSRLSPPRQLSREPFALRGAGDCASRHHRSRRWCVPDLPRITERVSSNSGSRTRCSSHL